MEEVWKDVVGFEGLYKVSNLGNVKSCPKKIVNWKGDICNRKENPVKQFINHCGYYRVTLYKNGKPYSFTVHRLVALAFIPNTNNYGDINHIDFNKRNNNINNLEWCSRSYNVKHAIKHNPNILSGIIQYKEKIKKPVVQYSLEGEFIKEYPSVCDAMKETGASHIYDIANKRLGSEKRWLRKTAGGFIWRYKGDEL